MDRENKHLDWVDGLKAFAIIGILMNHFVESFGSFPWFSNPSYNWPDVTTRLANIFPADGPIIFRLVQFSGWLGDMGPGVFILLSGFTLAISAFRKYDQRIDIIDFYHKRLIRILPLYMVIHFLIMFLAAFLSKEHIELTSPKVLLSLLGLRFTDGLFFFINPSWWFIWLIIQFYLVFPFLYRYMKRSGIKTFLIASFLFTIISRAAGLLNLTYSDNLLHWMMGIFFGTRLFEFAIGMALAKLFLEKQIDPMKFSFSNIFLVSFPVYIIGFLCSLFYPTTLISAPLLTIGLSGLFLLFWKAIVNYLPLLKPGVRWIGLVSFSVFLIHQPFLVWVSGPEFSGKMQIIISMLVIILAFPASWLLELITNHVIRTIPLIKKELVNLTFVLSLTIQVILNILLFFSDKSLYYYLDVFIFIINILFIPLYFLLGNKINSIKLKIVLIIFIPTSLIFCFILTRNWFSIFWITIILQLSVACLISLISKSNLIRIAFPILLIFSIFLAGELFLVNKRPVETNRWGEFPSLQKDSITVYSLIPNKITHLKYNNYDYYVKTNSLGFNGPEPDLTKEDTLECRILIIGDAFTMPEGMEYDKAYPELLRKSLAERFPLKKIKVYNAGVTGFGPNEMYAQLNKYIDIIKPDIYINQVFINEFSEVNLVAADRLESLAFTKLSFREELFGNSQIPRQLSSLLHKLMNDKIHKRYNHIKSLSYFYQRKSELYSVENINRLNEYFLRLKDLCERKNCRPVVLYAPGQLEISKPSDIVYYPYDLPLQDTSQFIMNLPGNNFRKICNNAGLSLLDPTKALKTNKQQPVYYKGSWHWNSEGHKVIAAFLSQEITQYIVSK